MANLFAMLAFGFFLGMRHATDPDHVVAMTAIVSRERTARAALRVGALWGLGHTATIALLVLATIHSPAWAVVYLGVFGLGTILGMVILTLMMAVPKLSVGAKSKTFEHTLIRVTGLVSITLGLLLAYRIGVVDGLVIGKTVTWLPN